MKKLLCVALAVLMALGCFAGCSGSGATGSTTATIKIGGTGPLTGDYANYGIAAMRGAQIAVDEINALGGIQFELKYVDDQGDPEAATTGFATLMDWGMQISLGGVTSGACEAFAAEAYEERIFTLTPSASNPSVNEGKDNIFQMCFTDPNQGSASAQYIYNQFGTDVSIAVIYQNDLDYSTSIYQTFADTAAELGLSIVSTTTFTDETQTNFSVQVAAAKDAGAEIVFLPIYYTPASLILAEASNVGYTPTFFGVDGMDGILTMDGFDTSLALGALLLTPFSALADDVMTQYFVAAYEAAYGETPIQFAADGYDCIWAIYQACEAGGITASMSASEMNDILIAQFTTMTFDGITGSGVTWASDGTVSKEPMAVAIQDGAYVSFSI